MDWWLFLVVFLSLFDGTKAVAILAIDYDTEWSKGALSNQESHLTLF